MPPLGLHVHTYARTHTDGRTTRKHNAFDPINRTGGCTKVAKFYFEFIPQWLMQTRRNDVLVESCGGGGIASLKTESRLKAMSHLQFYRALLALLSTDWNRPSDRARHTCSLRRSSPTSHRSTAYHRAQNRRVWTEHSRIGTATSASGQSTRRWWWCYSLGWQWRNVVPYLCQLVFATILWVKLR